LITHSQQYVIVWVVVEFIDEQSMNDVSVFIRVW